MYVFNRDVLPFPLELPDAIIQATTHTQLENISHLGLGKNACLSRPFPPLFLTFKAKLAIFADVALTLTRKHLLSILNTLLQPAAALFCAYAHLRVCSFVLCSLFSHPSFNNSLKVSVSFWQHLKICWNVLLK